MESIGAACGNDLVRDTLHRLHTHVRLFRLFHHPVTTARSQPRARRADRRDRGRKPRRGRGGHAVPRSTLPHAVREGVLSAAPSPGPASDGSAISLDLLHLYVAIAETGSIAGAARAMGISPSLASRRVMRLEMALSARLLVRSTRRLQFTTAGTLLLDWVNGTITSFGALREALAADGQAYSGLVRVASNDYLGRRFLSNSLVRLRFRFTALSFVVTVASDPLLFLDRGYDLVVHAGAPPTGSVIGRKVMSYRRVLCASPDYVARRGRPARPQDLAGHDCLGFGPGTAARWQFRGPAGTTAEQPVAIAIGADSYPLLLDMAVAGAGILPISETMAAPLLASGDLVELLADFPCVEPGGGTPAVWIVYRDRQLKSRARLVLDLLMEELRVP